MTYPIAFLAAVIVTALAQMAIPRGRMRAPHAAGLEEPQPVRAGNGLWAGLILATGIMAHFQRDLPAPTNSIFEEGLGPTLWWLLPAAAPLLAVTLASDFGRPKSERHALGLIGSGIAIAFLGFSISVLSAPWQGGSVGLAPYFQVVFTILWLFLLASIVELISLVPMGVTLFGLALSGVTWLSGGHQQTVASYALAGVIGGALVGRAAGDTVLRRAVPWGKAELFTLGLWLTAMTNVAFLKSVALAGFVLPLGVAAVTIILVTIRAFERSLLLRETPRAE